jgi:superfamily II DNA or RNA helicase/transcriptional regulator with XRE-family HTH domain
VATNIEWGATGPWPAAHVSRWLEGLEEAKDALPADAERRGRDRLADMGPFLASDARKVLVSVKGAGRKRYVVTLLLDVSEEPAWVDNSCACPWGGDCKHVWAACARLEACLGGGATESAPRPSDSAPRLATLDRLLGLTGAAPHEAEEELRLQARVRVLEDRRLSVELYERSRRADGTFTPGRVVSPQRLQQFTYAAPGLPSAGRALGKLLKRSLSRYYYGGLDAGLVLELLAGRDDAEVVWAATPSRPAPVRRAEMALRLVADAREVRLVPVLGDLEVAAVARRERRFDQYGQEDDDPGANVYAIAGPGDAITVGRAPDGAAALVKHLAETPLRLARTALGELATRLAAIERVLPVRVPDELLVGPTRAADGRVRLLLEPRAADASQGVSASIRVRPLDDRGAAQLPGDGPTELLASNSQGLERVRRDLTGELARAASAVAALGLAGRVTTSAWTWDVDLAATIALVDLAPSIPDLVVEWPKASKLRVSRELGADDLRVQVGAQRDWFGVEGALEVDGERVALATVLAALRGDAGLVALGDGRLLRLSADLRRRLEALRDAVRPRRDRLEVDATAAPLVKEALDGLAHVDLADTWCDVLRRLDAARTVSVRLPAGLKADLRGYQREGWAWLKRLATWGAGACLADDMGLGKTVQAIAVLLDRAALGPALVVAPLTVGPNWLRELARFAPSLRGHAHRETERDAAAVRRLGPGDVLVVSYELARIDAAVLGEVEWGTLVLDEAQRVKNATTKTAQALGDMRAGWRLALTGTPVENHLGDLWSLFRNVSPGLLGSWDSFRARYALPIEVGKDVEARAALARLVRPFLLRRTKADVLHDLPARSESRLDVELSDGERTLYDDARLLALANLEGAGESARFQVLAALTRLRQLACHPGLVDAGWRGGSAKLTAFLELVREVRAGGHRALVFSQFTQHLALLRAVLDEEGVRYAYLDGGTPARERQRRVDAFQAGEGELFLISLKAGGTGLNLTGADVVIHMDPWWNPAVEDQATDRAHRIGQTKPVTVYRLVSRGTIEEQILALHEDKRDLVAGVLDGSDRAGKLTTDELIHLIRGGDEPATKRTFDVTPAGLAAIRATLGLTTTQAGARVGVSGQSYRNWEAGRCAPSAVWEHALRVLANEARRRVNPPPPAPAESALPPLDAAGIRALREHLGVTRLQLAELIRSSAGSVSAWERGRVAPSAEMIERLRRLRSTPIEDLRLPAAALARRAAR